MGWWEGDEKSGNREKVVRDARDFVHVLFFFYSASYPCKFSFGEGLMPLAKWSIEDVSD